MRAIFPLLLSFLNPCGRVSVWGFWWRQLLLAPLFAAGSFVYGLCSMLAHSSFATYPLDNIQLVRALDSLSLPNFLAGVMSFSEAERHARELLLLHKFHIPREHILIAHADTLIPLGKGLMLLVCWCILALLLRRLRDTRLGLWGLLPCALLPLGTLCPEMLDNIFRQPSPLPEGLLVILLALPALLCSLPGKPQS